MKRHLHYKWAPKTSSDMLLKGFFPHAREKAEACGEIKPYR